MAAAEKNAESASGTKYHVCNILAAKYRRKKVPD